MATDYVLLLRRAIQTLEQDNPQARYGIYDRARGMVETSLRARMPAMPEASIRAEQAALEDAIWQVEMDSAGPSGQATRIDNSAADGRRETADRYASRMRYVRSVLQPGERILARGRYHWIIYADAIAFLLVGFGLAAVLPFMTIDNALKLIVPVAAGLLIVLSPVMGFRAWFNQWTTEIAVTNFRVIRKSGFIRRRTWEMNMDKIESVTVDQSILGRVLGYGTVHVLGTGEGTEHLHQISTPLELRNRIVAR
jgi:hypothetical protein